MTKIKSIKERREFVDAHQLDAHELERLKEMINELSSHPIDNLDWREICIDAKHLFRDYEAAKFYYLSEPTRDRKISLFIDRTNRDTFREAREVVQEAELCELFRALKLLLQVGPAFVGQRPAQLGYAFRDLNTDING